MQFTSDCRRNFTKLLLHQLPVLQLKLRLHTTTQMPSLASTLRVSKSQFSTAAVSTFNNLTLFEEDFAEETWYNRAAVVEFVSVKTVVLSSYKLTTSSN